MRTISASAAAFFDPSEQTQPHYQPTRRHAVVSTEVHARACARSVTTTQSSLPSPCATGIGAAAANVNVMPLSTDDVYDEQLADAFEASARDLIEQATEFDIDVLMQAIESVSEDVAMEAFHRMTRELETAEWHEEHTHKPLHALLHRTHSVYARKRGTPPFASLVRLGRSRQQYLLSHNPGDCQARYLASLWQHKTTVAVALTPSSVWPSLLSSRTIGPFRVTTVGQSAQTMEGILQPLLIRRVRLQYEKQEMYFTVFQLAWPSRQAVPASALAILSRLLRHASKGRTIAIHCRKGIGRSGAMALANALCSEEKPLTLLDALALFLQLRLQRHGAVETPKQFVAALRSHQYST